MNPSTVVREAACHITRRVLRRLLSPWTILVALICASVIARAISGLRIGGLWIAPDEMIWAGLGRRLWEHGDLRLFGGAQQVYGVVYPALVGGPLSLAGLERGYDALKVVQPIVMSLTAVPVFLWARRLATPGWALLAAALTLAVPGLLYSGLVMSEVAFYPALVLAAWATAAVLEEPSHSRQALLVGAVVLAAATRLQALVLPLVVVTAAGPPRTRAEGCAPCAAALARVRRLPCPRRGVAALRGSPSASLGSYPLPRSAGYSVGDVLRFTEYHAAAVLVLVALIPACAVALLVVEALAGRERSPGLAAYSATVLALTALARRPGRRVHLGVRRGFSDRYLLPLAPVLFVGFAAWLARERRGRASPPPGSSSAPSRCSPCFRSRDLIVQSAAWQSLGVVPLLWLRALGRGHLELVFWLGAAVALVAFALVPRRGLLLLACAPLAVLVIARRRLRVR